MVALIVGAIALFGTFHIVICNRPKSRWEIADEYLRECEEIRKEDNQ